MDHLERIGKLRSLLACGAVASLVLTACVGGDQTTAGLATADAEQTLPTVSSLSSASDAPRSTAETAESTANTAESTTETADTEAPTAPAQETTTTVPAAPLKGLAAEVIAEGFDQPILVTGAPGTDALFVVEREGLIFVVENGTKSLEPFLDLRNELTSSSIEQGLLGLAFHPDYERNGRLFAYWTDTAGDSVLAEFEASNPTTVKAESMQVILQVDQPAERHNAGMISFGPDGLLYLALGDGGSGGSTAQDTSNLLGTVLRLDVQTPGSYSIPSGNPFDDEIWVYGLRNPWRFSIDHGERMVYIGDVGQDGFEEINVVSLDGAGTNFGWFEMEGDRCFRGGCTTDGLTNPILQYDHDEGCSVTGGWVYRGAAIPELNGHYFFGDWCKSFVRSFRLQNGKAVDQLDWSDDLAIGQLTSFGVDNRDELYAVTWEGQLFKIVPVR